MKISRPCWDKYHRCPGWAGPGWGNPRPGTDCPSGSLSGVIDYDSRWWRWRFHQCPKCAMVVLPYWSHVLDPRFWWGHWAWRIRLWWRYRGR